MIHTLTNDGNLGTRVAFQWGRPATASTEVICKTIPRVGEIFEFEGIGNGGESAGHVWRVILVIHHWDDPQTIQVIME